VDQAVSGLNQTVVVVRYFTQLLAGTTSEPPTKLRIAETWSPPLNRGVLEILLVRHVIRGGGCRRRSSSWRP
jgi:hypothetical protein